MLEATATARSAWPALAMLATALAVAAYGGWQGWRNRELLAGSAFACTPWLAAAGVGAAPLVFWRARRAALATSRVVATACTLGGGAWLLLLLLAPAYQRIRTEATLAAGAGLFMFAVLLQSCAGTALPPRLCAIGRAGRNLVLALLLLELLLGGVARLWPSPLFTTGATASALRFAAHAPAPGELHFGFPANSSRCYDQEFPAPGEHHAQRAVAVIGDSFSYSFVPHRYHYTTVCERELGDVELWNFGAAALGPDEYQWLLDTEVMTRQPEAVVIALFLGNDLAEVRPTGRLDHWFASWFDRGNVLLFELPRRLLHLGAVTGGHALPADGQQLSTEGELLEHWPWLLDPAREPGTFAAAAFLQLETERARVFATIPAARWTALQRRLRTLRAAAAGRPFGVLLIPDEAMVEDALWQQIVAGAGGEPLDRDALPYRLVAECAAAGIPVLDLLPLLRAEPPMADGDRHLYLRRDSHWNVRGNAVAGRALATFVRTLLR